MTSTHVNVCFLLLYNSSLTVYSLLFSSVSLFTLALVLHLSLMTPLYQQSSIVDQKEEDQQRFKLFTFSSNQASSSSLLSWPASLSTVRDQSGCQLQDHQAGKSLFSGESTDHMVIFSTSSSLPPVICEEKVALINGNGDEDNSCKIELKGSVKWVYSKMGTMQTMVNDVAGAGGDSENRRPEKYGMSSSISNKSNNTIRVCSDCKTTTTPLWRSGPQGPKSLCNACGIRQRKARRAMAEAAGATANSTVVSSRSPSLKQNKEKKSRTTTKIKITDGSNGEKELRFNNFALSLSKTSAFGRVFPRDEEEGAILLMELSCGFVHA